MVLDATIGTRGQALGRDQRSEQVANEPLERGTVGGVHRGVGMEREAVDERAAHAVCPRGPDVNFGAVEPVGPADHWPMWVDVTLPPSAVR